MVEPICVGREKQLFLDGYLIEWREKMERRVRPVEKHAENPLVRPEAEWEPSGYVTYGSVIYDEEEGIYKMWCQGLGGSKTEALDHYQTRGVYYFTSADGIRWQRPKLDVVSIAGNRTNIVALSCLAERPEGLPAFYELFGVSKDALESDPRRRYKMGYLYLVRDYSGPHEAHARRGQLRGLGVAFSANGVNWTPVEEAVTYAIRDGGTYWFWDEKRGCYRLYGRTRHLSGAVWLRYGEDRRFQLNNSARAVNGVESTDFVHWEPEDGTLIISADVLDGPGDEIYSLSVFPYEGIYIGLLQMFHNYEEACWLDIQLAASRDGVHFERLSDRTPFIPVGQVGEWDRFNQSVANNPPFRAGDELRFYYSGRNYVHSGVYAGNDNGAKAGLHRLAGVGVGTIRLDRFAAMEASFDVGKLLTKPIIFAGDRLHVNANVAFGKLGVRLLDGEGHPLEHMEATVQEVNAVDIPMPLDLSTLGAKPVHIEFSLANGQLYSFWAE